MSEHWKKQGRECPPCPDCEEELYEKFCGQGGGVIDKRAGKNVDTHGSVTWDNTNSAKNIRCKTLVVQRYSRLPLQLEVLADRMVVQEAANGFISQRDDVFDDCFLLGLREELKAAEPNDFRVSTAMPRWLDALHLETEKVGGGP